MLWDMVNLYYMTAMSTEKKKGLIAYEVWGKTTPSVELCTKLHSEALTLAGCGDFKHDILIHFPLQVK